MIASLNTSLEMTCKEIRSLKISRGLDKLAMKIVAVARFGKPLSRLARDMTSRLN